MEADPAPTDPIPVFLHIPKTAGSTVTAVLRANEPGARTKSIANVFKGGGGVKRGAAFKGLYKNQGARLAAARILSGHLPLGSRGQLPPERDYEFFTFLREPVDRTLSHYFQVLITTAGRRRVKQPPIALDATLEEAVASGHIFSDLQTRMLSGFADPFDEVTDEMLAAAKRNLREELSFFGLAERFDESLLLAKLRLGLGSVLYEAGHRVNDERPRGEQIPAELRAAAERCNGFDIELYRYAQELFASAPELERLEFKLELAALRAATGREDEVGGPPPGFDGGGDAWSGLVGERVAGLRRERDLVEARAALLELGDRAEAASERIAEIA